MRLSRPISELKSHYGVVVIGSGYGGAIAAARLAPYQSVCVLERGKEVRPKQYADTLVELVANSQFDTPRKHRGDRTALYDFRLNKQMNIYQGCGLGGTSLVNASVAFLPDDEMFRQQAWPAQIRDAPEDLAPYFERAAQVLEPKPHPGGHALHKVIAHKKSASAMPKFEHSLVDITVSFEEKQNAHGVHMSPCVDCGDCITGCNHRAKNTLIANYLPIARANGAEMFCEVGVRWIERVGGEWLVRFELLDAGGGRFDAPPMFVRAGAVVLGAGSLGTTEILLRSRAEGKLPLSANLGKSFSGNGDVIGFAYNCDDDVDGVGFGAARPREREPVGPCIVSVLDNKATAESLEERSIIEEGAMPGGLAALLAPTFAWCSAFVGRDTDFGLSDWLKEKLRLLWGLFAGARSGATERTQTYLAMGDDRAGGEIVLERDRARVVWSGAGKLDNVVQGDADMHRATAALGGTYVKNPLWTRLFRRRLLATHPLGGCGMGDDGSHGVIDHKGRVFAGSGVEVHDGLYVTCGASIPRSIGVNPFMTISALAERTCALMIEERNWERHGRVEAYEDRPDDGPVPIGLRFTERMRGHVSTSVKDAPTAAQFTPAAGAPADYARYRAGAVQGRADGSEFAFTLTVVTEDLDDMLVNDQHEAHLAGTVTAPALDKAPLMVTGKFKLLVKDPADETAKRMSYNFDMISEDGVKRYSFEGFKDVRDDSGFDLWADTTTLFVTIREDSGDVFGQGVLRIKPRDFLRQMRTLRVLRAPSFTRGTEAKLDFAKKFMGDLADTYARWLSDSRSWFRRTLRFGWRLLWMPIVALLVVGLAVFPWRPNVARNQPLLVEVGQSPEGLPEDAAELGLFSQYFEDFDLSSGAYEARHVVLTTDWMKDTEVQTHGGLAPISFKPDDVARMSEASLRRGYLTLQHIHSGGLTEPLVGLGSQIETARFSTGVLNKDVTTDSEWSIVFTDGGVLFLTQNEGGPRLGELRDLAPWEGNELINHTVGPALNSRRLASGIVIGGTGAYAGVIGTFQEWNRITKVEGKDMHGATQMEIDLLVPARPRSLRGGEPTRERILHFRDSDVVYDVASPTGVQAHLTKVRDRRDVVVGLLGRSIVGGQLVQQTLTLPGEGTVFTAPVGNVFRIVDGTGLFAGAAGRIEIEEDPDDEGSVILRWRPTERGPFH